MVNALPTPCLQIYMTLEELDTLRGKNNVGMLLLGFKPLGWALRGVPGLGWRACPAAELSTWRKRCYCEEPEEEQLSYSPTLFLLIFDRSQLCCPGFTTHP